MFSVMLSGIPKKWPSIKKYSHSLYNHPENDAEIGNISLPSLNIFEQAREENLIKDFPFSVIKPLAIEVATRLAQQQAMGQLTVDDRLISQVIDAAWDAIQA
jgi:hypothetical protein